MTEHPYFLGDPMDSWMDQVSYAIDELVDAHKSGNINDDEVYTQVHHDIESAVMEYAKEYHRRQLARMERERNV